MMYYTLLSRVDGYEEFLFENPSTGLSKRGTFNRATGDLTLEPGELGWPAEDGRLRGIMLKSQNIEVGSREIKAFG
ncbi:hypothetical protein [Lacticaseibacillus pantheris]|uniref:hypothetical protein n=1 Tax=Lacticaseibacillus pantheris TaxID=171523 RepID=UPI0006CF28C3|nr:hypothetical protein [Lacticaseibacillus pantheris]